MLWNITLPIMLVYAGKEHGKERGCRFVLQAVYGIQALLLQGIRHTSSYFAGRENSISVRSASGTGTLNRVRDSDEGNSWNYTFYVPHDVKGLARLMGGQKKFIDKLQMVFDKGYYDPANEPDIAYPYLFSYFKGEEWRTQKTVRELLAKYFTPKPDGIPGNDDAGTMSAWAVFSMMGFYPDCPGVPEYTLTDPTFDRITIV